MYEDYADLRDHFEIVAFHDASAKSIKEIDAKLAERDVINTKWDGKNLPFPVLVDETRGTIDGWGIRAFPTLVLIDPDGKVVKGSAEHLLKEKLDALRAKRAASARPAGGEGPG